MKADPEGPSLIYSAASHTVVSSPHGKPPTALLQHTEAEELQRNKAAAAKALHILAAASGDPAQHPYALKKGVSFGPLVKRGAWPQRGWPDLPC